MDLSKVADILQIGFSGFAFLMTWLSYKLLKGEVERKGSGRKNILDAISKYIRYTLAMAVLVIAARGIEQGVDYYYDYKKAFYKQEQALVSSSAIDCRGAIDRLIHAKTKTNKEYNSLLFAIQESSSNCKTLFKHLSE